MGAFRRRTVQVTCRGHRGTCVAQLENVRCGAAVESGLPSAGATEESERDTAVWWTLAAEAAAHGCLCYLSRWRPAQSQIVRWRAGSHSPFDCGCRSRPIRCPGLRRSRAARPRRRGHQRMGNGCCDSGRLRG